MRWEYKDLTISQAISHEKEEFFVSAVDVTGEQLGKGPTLDSDTKPAWG